MAEDVEATHRRALRQRFDEYFGELRRTHEQLSVSRLAEELGYADSRFLDGLREGREYAKWDEVNDFCLRSGLNASWLKHGEEHPFSPEYAELDDLNALLRELEPKGDWPLYAVRSDCSEGLVCFVRRDSKYAWRIYNTTLHLSARNGGGGRMNLVRLYRFLKTIVHTGSGDASASGLDTGWKGRIVSHTLARSEFDTLVGGAVFPGALLGVPAQCYWAEDFPILEASDDLTRRLLASQGPEFQAAQGLVREALERLNEDWRKEAAALRRARMAPLADTRRTVACPVCGYPTPGTANANRGAEQPISVDCPRCGPFRVGEGVERLVAAGRVPRTKLSAWIRAHKESYKTPPTILQVRWSHFFGQSEGGNKVYSGRFSIALDVDCNAPRGISPGGVDARGPRAGVDASARLLARCGAPKPTQWGAPPHFRCKRARDCGRGRCGGHAASRRRPR